MLKNEFVGSQAECLELLEDYQKCFEVIEYALKSIDKYLDQWKIVISYKQSGK